MTELAAKFLAAHQLAGIQRRCPCALRSSPPAAQPSGYRIDPTDSIREGHRVFENNGVRIAVDALSLPYLQGSRPSAGGTRAAGALRQPEREPELRLR
jgi:hypothetical protein